MEFSKNVPTEPGNYWWRSSKMTPQFVRHVAQPHSWHPQLAVIEGKWEPVENVCGEWGPRIAPPQDDNSLPSDEVERIHILLDGRVPRADGMSCNDENCRSKLYHRIHQLIEQTPQDVPETVLETVRQIRRKLDGETYLISDKGLQALCDHIDPPPEPLRFFRGTFGGTPCVGIQREDGRIETIMQKDVCRYSGRNISLIKNLEWLDPEVPA